MRKIIICFVLLTFSFTFSFAQQEPQVYIVGSDGENAVYWLNGRQIVLPKISASAEAYAIAVSGSDVHIVGRDGYEAAYWLNGRRIALPGARAITVSGSDVYIVGSVGENAVYWLNGRQIVLPKISASAKAYAIAVSGSDVHIVGEDGYEAAYWLNGKRMELIRNFPVSYTNAVAVSGSNVYITGYEGYFDVMAPRYWLNSRPFYFPADQIRSVSAIAALGSNVYITGSYENDAVYLLNNRRFILPKTSNSVGASAIAVSGSDVYIVGSDGNEAVYWLNGRQIVLPRNGSSSSANGITLAFAREITLVNNRIEIDAALKSYAAIYERQTGVRINIISFGGDTPYAPNLVRMFNTGIEPEIFVFDGIAGYLDAKRSGRIVDLSYEPWVRDTDVAYIDPQNGNIVGFPVAIEGWGLGYNRALLARAGIDPATLTNINAIRAAFERIDAMKNQLDINAVVSMAAGTGMTWVTGLHGFNAYLALGLPYTNSTRYIDMLLRGRVDNGRLTRFAEYYNMLFRYANRNILLTGGYDQQLRDFILGRTVFIHQGNWIDRVFEEWGVTFEMGYIPHAFLAENTPGIFVGTTSWYVVNARAKPEGIQEAKKFLTAMASTPQGHDYMVNQVSMVPAFKSVILNPRGQLSRAVQQYSAQGKIYAWQHNEMPSGFGMDVLGPIFLQLAIAQITVQEFVRMVTDAVAAIR